MQNSFGSTVAPPVLGLYIHSIIHTFDNLEIGRGCLFRIEERNLKSQLGKLILELGH